jgi:hypothetical protein
VAIDPLTHVPVAAGPAYIERIRQLPSKFTVALRAEPGNRFNHTAVVVLSSGEPIGYLPADLSRRYFEELKDSPGVEVPGRHAPLAAIDDTGVEVLLDLSGVRVRSA